MTIATTGLGRDRIRPGSEYGFLGSRLLGLRGPVKRLLLRRPRWPDGQGASLTVVKSPAANRLGLRPVTSDPSSPSRFLEQDVTGLVSLDRAVLRALREGCPGRVAGLLRTAGQALDAFGHCSDPRGRVALQHPASLAVTTQGQIVPLDAELRVLGPWPPEAACDYGRWLGTREGSVAPLDASRRHARALVLYVRELIGRLQGEAAPGSAAAFADLAGWLGRIPSGLTLAGLEASLREGSSQWAADECPNSALSPGRWALRVALLLNLVLCLIITLQFGMRPRATTNSEGSYALVVPAPGTLGSRLQAALEKRFPGQVSALGPTTDRPLLLAEKRRELAGELGAPDAVRGLLGRLGQEQIRFAGAEGSPELDPLWERGGLFQLKDSSAWLAQPGGRDLLLQLAHLGPEDRELLGRLHAALADCQSLADALRLAGERPAYLVRVGPGEQRALQKQLAGAGLPVFAARAPLACFDAFEPAADTGSGLAAYTLRLDRPCYWRLVGRDDRPGAALHEARARWQSVAAGQPIRWGPLSLARSDGRIQSVSSFDLAVLAGPRVVVFRNQSILVGHSRAEVLDQARKSVKGTLGLPPETVADALHLEETGPQVTGTWKYSYLAERLNSATPGPDVEILDVGPFEAQRIREDRP